MLKQLSFYAQDKLAPHTMPMNYSQINVGAIGSDRPVDQWHLDSVDYVLVIILSDTRDMQGGRLEVVNRPTDQALQMLNDQKGVFSQDQLMSVHYPAAGYAVLMQGSRMLHHVTPVVSAREPRISLVNSFVGCNVFREDRTKV